MRAFAVIFLTLTLALTLAGAARGETFVTDVGGREVFMEVPDGYCALMGEDEYEARVMDFLAASMEDVATFEIVFADCGELEAWKQGRRMGLGRFGYIASGSGYDQAGFPTSQADLNRGMKERFSQMSESEFGQLMAQGSDRVQAMLDEMELDARIGQPVSLGYLGHDSSGIYIGLLQKANFGRGIDATMAVISSIILVQDRILLFYLADGYSGDAGEIDELLEAAKQISSLQHDVN